jgi:hypothetical protein
MLELLVMGVVGSIVLMVVAGVVALVDRVWPGTADKIGALLCR